MDEQWKRAKEMLGTPTFELGPHYAYQALNAPRHILFVLSRYKFAAQMLPPPPAEVLELGCSEGLGTLVLAEKGHRVTAVDFDADAIRHAQRTISDPRCNFVQADFMGRRFGDFDAAVSLDVIEHIPGPAEDQFVQTIVQNLKEDGVCILGTPNATAAAYASKASVAGHINLYTSERLAAVGRKHFRNVFMFGVNDEVVHTGFPAMCHYLMMVACGRRQGP